MRTLRTTVRLEEGLLREAKKLAAESGRTLTELIADGLREVLARRPKARVKPFRLPTYRGRPPGVQPGVDLDDSADLLDRSEER